MREYVKYLDEKGQATTRDKAVGQIVSVYDERGKLIEERFGQLDVASASDVSYKDK